MSLNEHNTNNQKGTIVNVQHFCIHDGEGIRTVVFFKGCPLHCIWCCNPETQRTEKELACYRNLCNGCMKCLASCEKNALNIKGKHILGTTEQCDLCGRCIEMCPVQALKVYGNRVTTAQIMEEISEDIPFYKATGGGVTLSGGEVLQQPDFAVSILRACRKAGIHTIVETSASAPWEILKYIAEWCDELYIDLKHMNASLHKMYTGISNEQIFSNIHKLSDIGESFVIRIPVIPGINDDENLLETFIFVRKVKGCKRIGLIPYHKYGISKYDALGKKYILNSLDEPEKAYLSYFKKICIEHFHIPCEIGW